jgi:hypothetical protein
VKTGLFRTPRASAPLGLLERVELQTIADQGDVCGIDRTGCQQPGAKLGRDDDRVIGAAWQPAIKCPNDPAQDTAGGRRTVVGKFRLERGVRMEDTPQVAAEREIGARCRDGSGRLPLVSG